jgi:hypothetical protein
MIKDIIKHCNENLGGVFIFKFIPVIHVQSIAQPIDNRILTPVVLKQGFNWLDFYATEGTMQLKEDLQPSDHGDFYKLKLTASVPKIRTEIDHTFSLMRNVKFLIDVVDNNGQRKLLGTLEEPLSFTFQSDTGDSMPKKNNYSVEFFAELTDNSPTYFV